MVDNCFFLKKAIQKSSGTRRGNIFFTTYIETVYKYDEEKRRVHMRRLGISIYPRNIQQ